MQISRFMFIFPSTFYFIQLSSYWHDFWWECSCVSFLCSSKKCLPLTPDSFRDFLPSEWDAPRFRIVCIHLAWCPQSPRSVVWCLPLILENFHLLLLQILFVLFSLFFSWYSYTDILCLCNCHTDLEYYIYFFIFYTFSFGKFLLTYLSAHWFFIHLCPGSWRDDQRHSSFLLHNFFYFWH